MLVIYTLITNIEWEKGEMSSASLSDLREKVNRTIKLGTRLYKYMGHLLGVDQSF